MKMDGDHVDASDLIARMSPPQWDGELLDYDLRRGSSGTAIAVGFYELEEFGVWSRQSRPYLILDRIIEGEFVLAIEARAYGNNIGRRIDVTIGDCTRQASFEETPSVCELFFEVTEPTHVVQFGGVVARSDATSDEPRSLGIGLTRAEFRRPALQSELASNETRAVDLSSNNPDRILVGFHPAESWGAWTGQDEAWIEIPETKPGVVELYFTCRSHAGSEGRVLVVECGNSTVNLPIGDRWEMHRVRLHPTVPTRVLRLTGWRTAPVQDSGDPRSLGVGLGELSVTQIEERRRLATLLRRFSRERMQRSRRSPKSVRIQAHGRTFLVPIDGNANDPSNSDVVIAFLYAYRRDPDALLFLVCSQETIADVFSDVLYLLARVERCSCRIVVVPRDGDGRIPSRLFTASDVFIRTPTAELGQDELSAILNHGLIIVAPRNRVPEGFTDKARTVEVALTRQPDRIPGDEHGYKRSLVDVVSWDDLVDAVTRAGALVEAVGR